MLLWGGGGTPKYIFRLSPPKLIPTPIRTLTFNIYKTAKLEECSIKIKPQKKISNFQKCFFYSTKSSADKENPKNLKDAVLKAVAPRIVTPGNRVTIVGLGMVGVACAFSILTQRVSSDLILIDRVENRLLGETLDFQHGSYFLKGAKIYASTDYKYTVGSRLCIVTSGVRQTEGETRIDLLQRNVEVMKSIIPPLIRYSPNAILLIVTNPVDVLTYVAWKLSGLPSNRVIGSGTNLDSSRFRFLISQRLGISATDCNGWIIGEHGDHSVPVWSGMNVATVNIQQLNPAIGSDKDPEKWNEIHKKVVSSADEVIKLKGYTSWAIGLSVSDIASAILNNSGSVHAVTVRVRGFHGITQDVFLSLPAVLGETGVSDILKQQLTGEERKILQASSHFLYDLQQNITL